MKHFQLFVMTAFAVLLLAPAPAPAVSLYSEQTEYSNMYMTARPKKVGDIVTIVIQEQSTAEETADTEIEKESEISATANGLEMLNPFNEAFPLNPIFDFGSTNEYEGEGETRRTNTVQARVASRVVRVADDGNLYLEGRRKIFVGDDEKTIIITGIVRPEDIRPDNTVISYNVADAEIRVEGLGPINNAGRPTILHRLLDLIPFF